MCKTLLCCHFVLYLQSPDSCPTWKLHEGYNLNPGKTSRPLVTHFLPLQHINFLFDSFSSSSHKIQLAGNLVFTHNCPFSFCWLITNVNFLWKQISHSIRSASHQADIFLRGLFSGSSSSSGLPRISLKKTKWKRLEEWAHLKCFVLKSNFLDFFPSSLRLFNIMLCSTSNEL